MIQEKGLLSTEVQLAAEFSRPDRPDTENAALSQHNQLAQVQMVEVCGGGTCLTVPAAVAAQVATQLNLGRKSLNDERVKASDVQQAGVKVTAVGVLAGYPPVVMAGGILASAGTIGEFLEKPSSNTGLSVALDVAQYGLPGGRYGGSISLGLTAIQEAVNNGFFGKGTPNLADLMVP